MCSVDGAVFTVPEDPMEMAAWDEEMQAFVEGFFGPERDARVDAFIEGTFYRKTTPALRGWIKTAMAGADAYAANSSIREMCRPEQWKLRSFSLPALTIFAVHPDYPMDNEGDMRRAFPDALAYVEWDDVGHYIMLETPERFNKTLAEFLAGLPE